jgi:hypothetical protein
LLRKIHPGTMSTHPSSSGRRSLKAIGYYYPHVGAPRVSAISSVTYAFAAAAPTMAPSSGTYTRAQTVTLATATDGVTIRYTTDGSPTRTSII